MANPEAHILNKPTGTIVGYDPATGKFYPIQVDASGKMIIASGIDGVIDIEIFNIEYRIHNIDEASDPAYYGFVRDDGAYYIMRSATVGTVFQYFKSDTTVTTYDAAWADRAAKTYTDWDGTA